MIGRADRPVLPRGVRCHHDRVRGIDVLLGPERVLVLEPVGLAILARVTGTASIADIATDLAAVYNAPMDVIEPDVIDYLQGLVDKRLVELAA